MGTQTGTTLAIRVVAVCRVSVGDEKAVDAVLTVESQDQILSESASHARRMPTCPLLCDGGSG